MLYYRYTKNNNPMSDWGHALFVNDPYKTATYGKYCWVLDSKDCTPIDSLQELIIKTWEKDKENGFKGDFDSFADDYCHLSGGEVFDSFNPEDIVESAEGWSCHLMVWFYERIALPNKIFAISTKDGAVCYDESLIKKAELDE